MKSAPQFVYAVLVLIAEGSGQRMLVAAPSRELEPVNLRLLKSNVAAAWAYVSHTLYDLASILIVLDKVLCLEVSSLARKLKLKLEITDDHPMIYHSTAGLWFRSMELPILGSTGCSKRPISYRRNVT